MKVQRFIQKHNDEITWTLGGILVVVFLLHFVDGEIAKWLVAGLLIIGSVIGTVPIAIKAFQALRLKTVSIELLVTIAVVGAFIIGEFEESAVVTFLFIFGGYLERRTLEKTRASIKSLTEMAPTTALLVGDDGEVEEIDIDEVEVGDVLLVKTGAQVPVDGSIVSGDGYLNEASVTGESLPVHKDMGDHIFAGSILENGTVRLSAEKVGEDTTFGKIIELVEEAQDTKSPAEKFIDKFARYYTPAVLVVALLFGLITQRFTLAITILVLGCPGALVIGAPVSMVAGIGNGAKHGALIKGGDVVSTLAKVDTLLFDKTGTVTKGTPAVTVVKEYSVTDTIRQQIAAVEAESDHPLGKAVVDYLATQGAVVSDGVAVTDTMVVKGQGVVAQVADNQWFVGNQALLNSYGITLTDEQSADLAKIQDAGNSVVLVADKTGLRVIYGIMDEVRPEVKAVLADMQRHGIKRMIMLTGDGKKTAEQIGKQLGLTEVRAEMLPENKAEVVSELQAEGHTVAFVGDGINDSPSLAKADIGVAMGGGTDVAIETSNLVLMQSNFTELNHAYQLARATMRNVRQNIAIAIITVLFLIGGVIYGYIYMASGMLVHELSILVVIANAMRLLNFRRNQQNLMPIKKSEHITAYN